MPFTIRTCLPFPFRCFLLSMLVTLTYLDLDIARAATLDKRESLIGLPGVYVVIEDLRPDTQKDGPSTDAIRTAVEHILRSSGIQMMTISQRMDSLSDPQLYVRISTAKDRQLHLYAYDTTVELIQLVSLVGKSNAMVHAVTWQSTSQIELVKDRNMRDIIKRIEDQVKDFANDFLVVNPR